MLRMSLAAAVSLIALEASAGGFAVREQSTTSQGASFAGAATSAGGLSGMFWNPAVITQVPGINFESHAALILGFANINPISGSGPLVINRGGSGNIAQPALVPASYSSYQVTPDLFVGMSVNSPFGLKTDSRTNWAGQVYGRYSSAFNVMATPTVGYKINDWLSIGAGVQISYLSANLRQAISYTPSAPSATLKGDSWGVGYTLGATITPMAGTEIGIGFRSSVRHDLKGTLATPASITAIKAQVDLPDMLTVGLRQKIGDKFAFLAGYEWSNWSRVGTPLIRSAVTGAAVSKLPFNYKDGWMVSVGGEYRYNESLLLRAGLAYEKSPVTDAVRSVRIPDNDRIWASIGASYQVNQKLSIDAAYTHVFVKDPNVYITSASNPHYVNAFVGLKGAGKAHVDILSVSLRYRWDNPPARAAGVFKG